MYTPYLRKLPFIHTSMDSSVNPSGRPSITSSLSAEKPSKLPCNNGEKHAVNYLHEIMVKSPSIHTLYGMSVIAPVHALSIPSICTSYIPSVHTSYIMSVIASVHALSVQHVHTLCITSVIAPVRALPIPSIHLTDDEPQEFPDEFASSNYQEKNLSIIMAKVPDNITLTLQQAKLSDDSPRTTNGVKYPDNFPSGLNSQ